VKNLFNYITVISAIVVITTVLLQSQDAGLGGAFGGGGGGEGGGYRTKRGAERSIYYLTIGAGVVFVLSVILSILAKN
jgi:protein translocase SecG subunit